MDLNELQELIASLEASGMRSLELSRPGERVKLTIGGNSEVLVTLGKMATEPALPAVAESAPSAMKVVAESAGIFVATHPMRNKPLAVVGDVVRKNDVLGLLKVGPIYAPITAPTDGLIARILADDGALLGFGAVVMEMEAAAENLE